ncbi:hypothetical protein SDRG_15295 [Saprolegnia diclina VS20]|uniref:Uncharacterized protein n=1 Tax=Saprolegnia diclina (strain VS20) TaxID=1156394 RepID=T0RBE5_SAPDV|nr:hypothetical protein SDRG_15295 [Saprolegnia diclina VS20]EQC26872.1 hypothetical protein SDRG_15295 [Saprolegnia diclina VS20]|eukprot:XP_008619685.1 hypothetical protein SDRG_15295 [Saprolegnia diclina VS20]
MTTPATFVPMSCVITEAGLLAAIHEFKRREANGEDDGDLLIARNVLLLRWIDSYQSRGAVFRATYEAAFITKTTRGDVYIAKAHSNVNSMAMGSLQRAFDVALMGMPLKNIRSVDFTYGGHFRTPDLSIKLTHRVRDDPCSHLPRGIVEVLVPTNTSFSRYHADTLTFFDVCPPLQTVLTLVLYPLRDVEAGDVDHLAGEMPALALLYRRLASGVTITDAVSCGNSPLYDDVYLPGGVRGLLRDEVAAMAAELPLVVERQPWNHGPFVTLYGDDLYRAADGVEYPKDAPADHPNCRVHLATTIAAAIEQHSWEAAHRNSLAAQAAAQVADVPMVRCVRPRHH